MKKFILIILSVSQLHSQDKPDLEFNDVINIHTPYTRFLDPILKRFGRSSYARELTKFLQEKIGGEVAESNEKGEYLFRAAQSEVGVPKEDQLPVVDDPDETLYQIIVDAAKEKRAKLGLNENSQIQVKVTVPVATGITAAFTTPEKISINKLLRVWPLGTSRCIARHEATHHLYNDSAIKSFHPANKLLYSSAIFIASLASLAIARKHATLPYRFLFRCLVPNSVAQILYPSEKQMRKYIEQRADIEGFRVGCYRCVKEALDTDIQPDLQGEIQTGYLSSERIQIFYDRYKQAGCLCPFHKKREHDNSPLFIRDIPEEELKEYAQQAHSA
ncbi:hypothetical protein A3F66_01030 [candidate division TM6 bacterium RIFCSPHIGHO2_12_FULL_32_22]|nr:MAG: hypothetical protein A3F66_01030 [candidate division TM6 bacterium RIFCSPHIGHO2_12_FULL_32_22]